MPAPLLLTSSRIFQTYQEGYDNSSTIYEASHRASSKLFHILKIPSQLVCAIDVIAAGLGLYGYPWTDTMSSSTLQSDGHAHPDIHPHSHSHCHGHSHGHDHGHGQDTWSGEEYLARPGV